MALTLMTFVLQRRKHITKFEFLWMFVAHDRPLGAAPARRGRRVGRRCASADGSASTVSTPLAAALACPHTEAHGIEHRGLHARLVVHEALAAARPAVALVPWQLPAARKARRATNLADELRPPRTSSHE